MRILSFLYMEAKEVGHMNRFAGIVLSICTMISSLVMPIYSQDLNENVEIVQSEMDATSEGIFVSKVINGVEVSLKASAHAFDKDGDITLHVEEITDERLKEASKTIEDTLITGNQELKSYRLFDITPMIQGKEVQPIEPVTVSFKNLMLTNAQGKEIDVRKKIEEDKIMNLLREDTDDSQIVFYHFDDPKTPNEIVVDANEEETLTSLEHFSWTLVGSKENSGGVYEVGDDRKLQSYESESGNRSEAYTLDYILGNYNIFCSGDYLGTHVVGPMVVGGQTMLNGAVGGTTRPGEGVYVHTVPSYFEGYIYNRDYTSSFPRIITERQGNLALYFGRPNLVENKHKTDYEPFYTTPNDAYLARENANDHYTDRMYVDFQHAFPTNVKTLNPSKETQIVEAHFGNLPSYGESTPTTIYTSADQFPWNQDDHQEELLKTDAIEPNGWLYKGIDGNDGPGSINYYRNFNGYDVNGSKVNRIHIHQNTLSNILKEVNEEGLDGVLVETKRQEGRIRYYTLKGEELVPVDELNAFNNGKGASVNDFKNGATYSNGEKISKYDYVFAVDTNTTQVRGEGDVKDYTKPVVDVSLRLRPGYNFIFDTFSTAYQGLSGTVKNVVYDYIDETEMSGKLTIININELSEKIMIPRIYKSVEIDSYGSGYQFDSIEKGPGFSVLWFAPYCREVYVGFKNPTVINKDNSNGSKLVGHLVVPQADVWVGGGDYNGGIIARNIDASSSGSEGHMWPFKVGYFLNGIQIRGKKTIEGQSPKTDERFLFKFQLEKATEDSDSLVKDPWDYEYIPASFKDVRESQNKEKCITGIIESGIGGDIYLKLTANKYFDSVNTLNEIKYQLGTGRYRLIVSEVQSEREIQDFYLNTDESLEESNQTIQQYKTLFKDHILNRYILDTSVYYGYFKIKQRDMNEPSIDLDPSASAIVWQVDREGKGASSTVPFEEYKPNEIVFNNSLDKSIQIKKEWKDENGNVSLPGLIDEIKYDLYRTSKEPKGHKIVLNLFSTDATTGDVQDYSKDVQVNSSILGYVDDHQTIKFNVDCTDSYESKWWVNEPAHAEKAKVPTAGTKEGFITAKKSDGSVVPLEIGYSNVFHGDVHNLYTKATIELKDITSDIIINARYIVRPIEYVPLYGGGQFQEFISQGGYTFKDGTVLENVTKDQNTALAQKRTIIPDPKYFEITFRDDHGLYPNIWNNPEFERKDLIKTGTLTAQQQEQAYPYAWCDEIKGLPVKDEKGYPYYYKIEEHKISGYTSTIDTPIFTLPEHSTEQVVKTIHITNTKSDGVDIQLRKLDYENSQDGISMIKGSPAIFKLYPSIEEAIEDKNAYDFDIKAKPIYEILYKKNKALREEIATDHGYLNVIGLKPNGNQSKKYYLKEIQAPNGYVCEDRILEIEVKPLTTHSKDNRIVCTWFTKDGFIEEQQKDPVKVEAGGTYVDYQIDYTNKQKKMPPLPGTGGLGLLKLVIVGVSFVSIGLWILRKQRRHTIGGKTLS